MTPGLALRLPALLFALGVGLLGLGPTGSPPVSTAAEKSETWIEVRSPHFTVYSNASEKDARRAIQQFELVRATFQKALVNVRVDPGQPILIFAVKNEKSMKALIPAYWEQKGGVHPAGIFVPGREKHYVAMRLDSEGLNPYKTLYHEYVHMLVRLNFESLPVWLNEGYAEFFGNTVIGDKETRIGKPDPSHVYLLRESRLIPLDTLLRVAHGSPHYSEANKASVFYAQSWALVHMFLLDARWKDSKPITKYIQLVRGGTDETSAAQQAFGDLKKLQKDIEGYVRATEFYEFLIKQPSPLTDKDFQVRSLSPAESAAARGDFHMHMDRPTEARALLDEALRLDPKLALAHEAMGFLNWRAGNREEASRWFAQAVESDSKSAMAHYYHAMLQVEGVLDPEEVPRVEASLQKAIELNPSFAPAYSALATLYSMRQETIGQAIEAARKAVQLEPGEPHHLISLSQALLRAERFDDARAITQRFAAIAKSPQDRVIADQLLASIRSYEEQLAARKRYLEEQQRAEQAATREPPPGGVPAEATVGRSQLARRATPDETKTATGPPTRPPSPVKRTQYSMMGRITEVACTPPTELGLTLHLGGITMKLHAANYFKIDYLTTEWKAPAKFNPCTHLKGLMAKIAYDLAQGQSYDGEILTIEVMRP